MQLLLVRFLNFFWISLCKFAIVKFTAGIRFLRDKGLYFTPWLVDLNVNKGQLQWFLSFYSLKFMYILRLTSSPSYNVLFIRFSPLLDFVLNVCSEVDIHFVLFKFVVVLQWENMFLYWIIWGPGNGGLIGITLLK